MFRKAQARKEIQKGRRRARIMAALEREALGAHPEQVMIRWDAALYMPGERTYIRLPGMAIEMLIGSEEDLQACQEAMVAGITDWITNGGIDE